MNSFEGGPSGFEDLDLDPFERLEVRAAQLDWNDPTEVVRFEIDLAYIGVDLEESDDPFYEPHADYESMHKEQLWKQKRYASEEQKDFIYEREGGRCHYCDREVSRKGFEADHKVAWTKGGQTTVENLLCACYACNKAKFTMDYDEFVEKLAANGLEWRDRERDRVVALLDVRRQL
jgi:5-methylcytosine-specific restriction endonuclease McrA